MTNAYWPFFDLRITTPRLELRPGTDEDWTAVAAITDDIHNLDRLPFSRPWTRLPTPERERSFLQRQWLRRSELKPEKWNLNFAVFADGQPVGVQALDAEEFAITRSFETSSWLARSHQGQGFAKEMRAAVLFFGFERMNADEAVTGALDWNAPSQSVTAALGYEPNGQRTVPHDGAAGVELRYRMTRANWEAGARHYTDVQVNGHEACLPLLGATSPTMDRHGFDQTLS